MRIKTIIKHLLLHMIYFFVGFIPRDRKIWIFGSRNKTFFGNSKWLFLYLHNSNKKNIRKIWISRTKKIVEMLQAKGFEAYYLNSPKGYYYAVRGGIYIFNVHTNYDISYFLSRGAKKINLWHGVGIKKIGLDSDLKNNYFYKLYHDDILQRLRNRFFNPWEYEKYDMMICISEMTKKCMKSAFGKRAGDVVVTGYPCNDTLLKNVENPFIDEDLKLIKSLKAHKKKVILYMPTYRDVRIYESKSMDVPINWEKLNSFLEKNNSVFIVKLHPVKESTLQIPYSCKNILTPNNLNDIFPALKYVDILITDYSTVCYNFLLCSKPIIFYWYDLKEYKTEHRTLYEDFENLVLGPIVKTFDALLNALDNYMNNKEDFMKECSKKISNCQKLIHKYVDSNSSERVYKEIMNKFVKNQ
ncbi:MAG: hypothetical protein A2V69_01470 [Candidatus Portnoybacteria bacterium RBG_13_40_8]|uniref:Uncharacterized protein n=1 Tax=Candidatus Portnoybacteria bacterium RBG_13_40_8 TaxID=1801990 RepID=A0A1G2F6D4_9BACT|nr:MAG: hypothetical protein A2V69_01470 [Candidatus Portnoybacteria bacterium RBG_13_40_8]